MTLNLRKAKASDVALITDLLIANSSEQGGALYGHYSQESVAAWVSRESPTFIAMQGDLLAGVLFTASKEEVSAPPVLAMLAVWPGSAGAWIYGPVCVSSEMRGKRVLDALVEFAKAELAGREGLLFINSHNTASVRAHQRLGMPTVASFTLDNEKFLVMTTDEKTAK